MIVDVNIMLNDTITIMIIMK